MATEIVTAAAPVYFITKRVDRIRKSDRTLRTFPDDRWWRAIHEIADAADPAVRKAFLDAVAAFVSALELSAIERALEGGNVDTVMTALRWHRFDEELGKLDEHLVGVLAKAGQLAAGRLDPIVGFTIQFDAVNPRAVEWIRAYGAQRVVQVGAETRAAIQNVVGRMFNEGITTQRGARLIREHIGLTSRQSLALWNYRTQLIEDGLEFGLVEQRTTRYAARLLRERSINIARTETIDAAAGGQQALWNQAVAEGYIDDGEYEREWVAVVPSDGRTCELCAAMDGKRAALGQPYENGLMGPTRHPRCRCAERLVPKAMA